MKEKSELKGRLSRWTKHSSRWYEEAYLYSDYHKILASKICAEISDDSKCCELACGNGSLARSVAPYVKSYTANDIDHNAMEWLRNKIKEEALDNIDILEGDWKEVLKGQSFDAVIYSFFDAAIRDWDELKSISKNKIIIIAPREKKNLHSNFSKIHGPESFEKIISFFDENNVNYSAEPLDLEFGQPFYNIDDALEYVEHYYNLTNQDALNFIGEKFDKTDFGWYFPKLKKIGFIVADL